MVEKLNDKQKNQFIFSLQIAVKRAYEYGRIDLFHVKDDKGKRFEEWLEDYVNSIADASGLV